MEDDLVAVDDFVFVTLGLAVELGLAEAEVVALELCDFDDVGVFERDGLAEAVGEPVIEGLDELVIEAVTELDEVVEGLLDGDVEDDAVTVIEGLDEPVIEELVVVVCDGLLEADAEADDDVEDDFVFVEVWVEVELGLAEEEVVALELCDFDDVGVFERETEAV